MFIYVYMNLYIYENMDTCIHVYIHTYIENWGPLTVRHLGFAAPAQSNGSHDFERHRTKRVQ